MRAFPRLTSIIAALLSLSLCESSFGMGMEEFGPAKHMGVSSDWPKGVQPLLKHASRVYWQDVNGYSQSYFDGSVEQINELLRLFSEVELKRHMVILRMGKGVAKSFHGKQTPYSVKFDLPAGLFIFRAKQYANTGVYSIEPTLEIQVSTELLGELEQLAIPKNVQLRRSQYQLGDLLRAAIETDRSTRCRALRLIGEQGEDTSEVRGLLEKCLKEEDKYIRSNASGALQALDQQTAMSNEARTAFNAFVQEHPQLYRSPEAKQVFDLLTKTDQKYANDGFTARGTLVNSEGLLMNWTVTMDDARLVVMQKAVDEKATGRIEEMIFVSPSESVHIQQSQYWVDGKLTKSKPFKHVEPAGNTYDIYIGRLLWPLGRGFTRRIDRVESVSEQQDGSWHVTALGENNVGIRWELKVDPSSDYLIRQAKGFRTRGRESDGAAYIIDGAGSMTSDERSTNHTSRWQEGEDAAPNSIAVHEVSSDPDFDLFHRMKEAIAQDQP